jgi:LPXTG-site transpeptidase (sortase) family protein
LVLLFAAYELWGTSVLESHAQARLRAELGRSLQSGSDRNPSVHNELPAQGPRSTVLTPSSLPRSASTPPAVAPTIAAPPIGQPVGIIDIPAIGLDQVIVEGVGASQLATGPGHYPGTALPGEAGNAAIAGHRTTYARPFYDLDEVHSGDLIDVTTPQGSFVYDTIGSVVVAPSDIAVLDDTPGPELTLTTCNPRYSASTRLVLRARLVSSMLRAPPGGSNAEPPRPGRGPDRSPGSSRRPAQRDEAMDASGGLAGIGRGGPLSWWPVIGWGAAGALVWMVIRTLARRARHPWRWWAMGSVPFLGALFMLFAALDPHLPAGL